jgi:hypothetical protein
MPYRERLPGSWSQTIQPKTRLADGMPGACGARPGGPQPGLNIRQNDSDTGSMLVRRPSAKPLPRLRAASRLQVDCRIRSRQDTTWF